MCQGFAFKCECTRIRGVSDGFEVNPPELGYEDNGYWGNIGIMAKKVETTIRFRV